MSMPPHALGFYSPQAGSGRAAVKEESAHLSDARWRHAEARRPQPMSMSPCSRWTKIVAQQCTRIACVLACSLRLSREPGCGLVAKLAWESGLPGDQVICISKTVTAYRSASLDITHHLSSPELACLIAPRCTPSIGAGTAACDPNRTSRPAVLDTRKPEAYLFSMEAFSISLSRELPPLPAQECMTTLYPR
jgi:hypothetical protein